MFAVVDDVYDLEDRDGWIRKIEAAFIQRTPPLALITCGPTEQREQFEKHLKRHFEVAHFEVPHLTIDECKAFLVWYEARTGKSRDLNQITTENALLVQFVFELTSLAGVTLEGFAHNFKRRLKHLKAFDETRAILAVNSLYMDAPSDLLASTESRAALRRLSREDQYHFLWTQDFETNKDGVRLAHAHLAWLLFTEWAKLEYPTTIADVWARELVKCLRLFEKYTLSRKSSNLLGQLFSSTRLSDDEDIYLTANRRELIRELYRLHIADNEGVPTSSTLSRWLDVGFKISDLQLVPDPVNSAVTKFSNEFEASELHGSAAGWVWLISESRPAAEAEQLRTAVKQFAKQNPDNPGVGRSLGLILAQSRNKSLARQFIGEWLSANAAHPQAHFVIAPLIKDSPSDTEIRLLATTWLAANGEHPEGHQVIAPLMAANPNDARVKSMAIDWLANNEHLPHAYWLLASLVKAHTNDARVKNIAWHWVTTNGEHPKIHYVLVR